MTQQPLFVPPSARPRLLRPVLLLALAGVLGCDQDITGPRTAAEPPPQDEMRLVNLVFTDTQFGSQTRHHFMYDDAGRLKRVDFFISRVAGGPPDRLTRYTEHTYAGGVLTETNHFFLDGTGEFVNSRRVNYTYDRLGYLVSEMRQRARTSNDPIERMKVDTFVTRHRYDRQGRRSETREPDGDVITYSYGTDGLLAMAEDRTHDAPTQRRTFTYAGGRNPFYHRLAHVNSVLMPIELETTLLAPVNLRRLENRVDPESALVASLTNEYDLDDAGRPRRIRQFFINDIDPGSRGTGLFFDLEYEPAPGS